MLLQNYRTSLEGRGVTKGGRSHNVPYQIVAFAATSTISKYYRPLGISHYRLNFLEKLRNYFWRRNKSGLISKSEVCASVANSGHKQK